MNLKRVTILNNQKGQRTMRRVRRGYVAAAALAATMFASSVCLGLIPGPRNGGTWPDTWPEQLEPYRKQAWTLEITHVMPLVPRNPRPHGLHETVYKISFDTPEDFEEAWPAILQVKDKGAPLILESSPFYYPRLGRGIETGVLILCPIGGKLVTGDGTIKFTDRWGTIERAFNGLLEDLPEYVVADDGKWVPFDGSEGEDFIFRERDRSFIDRALRRGSIFQARTDIVLITDGKIVDLNRIRLPANTPIIDNRFGRVEKQPVLIEREG